MSTFVCCPCIVVAPASSTQKHPVDPPARDKALTSRPLAHSATQPFLSPAAHAATLSTTCRRQQALPHVFLLCANTGSLANSQTLCRTRARITARTQHGCVPSAAATCSTRPPVRGSMKTHSHARRAVGMGTSKTACLRMYGTHPAHSQPRTRTHTRTHREGSASSNHALEKRSVTRRLLSLLVPVPVPAYRLPHNGWETSSFLVLTKRSFCHVSSSAGREPRRS